MPIFDGKKKKKKLPMIKLWKTIKPIQCKLLKPRFDKNKFKWPPLQIPTLSPRKILRVAKARLCSLAINIP